MASEESANAEKHQTYYLFSHKPPEEARVFGFRGGDIEDMWAPVEEEAPVSPIDWGFSSTSQDGICQYCQLMLHPEAPKVIEHQPNLATLIASDCRVCSWVEVSIVQGCPQLAERYQQGDPATCDPNSTSCAVTIELARESNFTRAIASIGTRSRFAERGVPLNLTTPTRLGDLFLRRFWEPFDTRDNTNPAARLTILKTWLGECQENHQNCSMGLTGTGDTILPTRVLDLSGSSDVPSAPEDIKIRVRETSKEELGRYTALSYCWGDNVEHHFKTTQQNLEQHKNGIEFSALPLTQREAILVTLFLGIRYLWVDSLCIVQDSPEDWERETATMNAVYSNAVLTLAATSSHSPADGLLNPFQAALCVNIHNDLAIIRMETHETIDAATEPLNTRAWCLQEAVLSPRTISFGNEQWLWKCAGRYATEDGLIDRPQQATDSLNYWYGIVNQHAEVDNLGLLQHWYRLVTAYSRRKLTYQGDKLKAIAGLANLFAKQTGHKFVAGLWAEDIANGLMWQATSRGVSRGAGTVPTWSWASVNGPVISVIVHKSPGIITLLKIEQEWQGEPMTSPLTMARLHVRGTMIKVGLGQQSSTQRLRYSLVKHTGAPEIFGEAFLDNLEPIQQDVTEVLCLHLYPKLGDVDHSMLLLVPTQDENLGDGIEAYRRIGIGIVWDKCRFTDGSEGEETLKDAFVANIVLV